MLRIADATGVDVPLHVLFQARTPATFAARIPELRERGSAAIVPVAREWQQ
jgi:hypothetical protein